MCMNIPIIISTMITSIMINLIMIFMIITIIIMMTMMILRRVCGRSLRLQKAPSHLEEGEDTRLLSFKIQCMTIIVCVMRMIVVRVTMIESPSPCTFVVATKTS